MWIQKSQICIFFASTQTNCRKKVDEEDKNNREQEEEKQIKKKWIDSVYKRRNSLKSCHDLEVIDNMHVIVVIREKIGI